MEKSRFRQSHVHGIEHYEDVGKVPIPNGKRRCTDILCIIVGLGLTITLAIFAIICYNQPQYLKQVFPADSDGNTCGYEYPGYNYLYFAKPTEMTNRVCVRSCPSSDSKPLACKKTSKVGCEFGSSVQYYPTDAVQNDYGFFCLPKDQGQRKVLMNQLQSYQRDLYYNSLYTIYKCLVIVGIVSILYMFFVQCCPRVMNRAAVVIGALALLAFTVTVLLYPSHINSMTRYIVFALALGLVLILICTIVKYFPSWALNGIFLDYASKFLCARLYAFVLPIVFLILGAAFYFLQLLQYKAFWSFGELRFDPSVDLYHHIKNPTKNIILSIFQIIQIIWGTMFLKEAFNYLISAEAVQWYYGKGSACGNGVFTLVCKHLGSVIACAFMNAFFGIADFVFDAIIPTFNDSNGCFYCINRFAGFFDLARSDALTMVYLSGNAFCNSARYCEYIANRSSDTSYSQSASRIYRFSAHFAIAGVVTLVAFWFFGLKNEVSISAMGILLLISMGVATFFISIHADAGEAILILYLMEYEFFQTRKTAQATSRFNEIHTQVSKLLNTTNPTQQRQA